MQTNGNDDGRTTFNPINKNDWMFLHTLLYQMRVFAKLNPKLCNPPEQEDIQAFEEYIERVVNTIYKGK